MNKSVMVNNTATLKNYLEKGKKSLASMIGNEKGAERLIRLALVANAKIPKIKDCTHESLLRCLIECAQVNLEPFTALQQAYIIPYHDYKKNITEAQFQIGYRGLIALARRTGKLETLEAHCVYENDEFECSFGVVSEIKHKPCWRGDRGEMIAVYAVAKYKEGGYQLDAMSRADVEKIRKTSKSANNGPWVTHFEEMAKKTVVKRLAKYLDLSPEFATAVEKDNGGDAIDVDFNFIDIDTPEVDIEDVPPVPSGAKLEAEKSIKDDRDELHKLINESTADKNLKSNLLNRLVTCTTKQSLDQIAQEIIIQTT